MESAVAEFNWMLKNVQSPAAAFPSSNRYSKWQMWLAWLAERPLHNETYKLFRHFLDYKTDTSTEPQNKHDIYAAIRGFLPSQCHTSCDFLDSFGFFLAPTVFVLISLREKANISRIHRETWSGVSHIAGEGKKQSCYFFSLAFTRLYSRKNRNNVLIFTALRYDINLSRIPRRCDTARLFSSPLNAIYDQYNLCTRGDKNPRCPGPAISLLYDGPFATHPVAGEVT